MIKADTVHRKLAIIVSPDGEFFTPTTPENYCEGQAIADVLSGKSNYTFRRVKIREKSLRKLQVRDKWIVQAVFVRFNHYPEGWEILEGRPFGFPKKITPEQARELEKCHD